jgi:Trypsin-like peptidase domain
VTTAANLPSFETLSDALRKSVVQVRAGNSRGTGFVVAKNLVLTCRHVVAAIPLGGTVMLTAHGGDELCGRVRSVYPQTADLEPDGVSPYPDLALLDVDERLDLPAVVLDATGVAFGEELTSFGWAADSQVPGQAKRFLVASPNDISDKGEVYIRVHEEAVVPGMSGAPVCNSVGLVCGYLRLTRGAQTTLGGWVVPFSSVIPNGLAPALQAAFEDPGPAAAEWARMITSVHLLERGRDRGGDLISRSTVPTKIDIVLARTPDQLAHTPDQPVARWTVRALDRGDCHAQVTELDLGAGVFEAVNHWSRRHTLPSKTEVEILGTLLGRAILPTPVSQLVAAQVAEGRPLIRIRMDDDEDLGDVPWEFARTSKDPLAARDDLVLSRFVDVEADPNSPSFATDTLNILVVIVSAQRSRDVYRDLNMTARALAISMERDLGRHRRMNVECLCEPSLDDFEQKLRGQRWDLVHYVGPFADRPNLLNFAYGAEDETGTREDVAGTELSYVAGLVRESGARMLVLQRLIDAMVWAGSNPPARATVREAFGSRLQAIVIAEHQAERSHVMRFNEALYAALDRGEAAEAAVQHARRQLFQSPPIRSYVSRGAAVTDYAAFGMVTVTTSRNGNVAMLTGVKHIDTQPSGFVVGGYGQSMRPQPEDDGPYERSRSASSFNRSDGGYSDQEQMPTVGRSPWTET